MPRKRTVKEFLYCDGHLNLCEDIAVIKDHVIGMDKRINGSIEEIAKHIEEGKMWRASIIGLAITLAITFVGWAYAYGRMAKTVDRNEKIIMDVLQEVTPGVNG